MAGTRRDVGSMMYACQVKTCESMIRSDDQWHPEAVSKY